MDFAPIPQEFYSGCCFDGYRFFGAHPAEGGWVFRVWAPGALEVQLCGDFNAWQGEKMRFAPGGVWSLFVPGAQAGQLYKFYVHGRDGVWAMHCDPYAFAAELRPDNAGVLTNIDFSFDDAAWMTARDKCYDKPLNIYELHAGSWKHRPGAAANEPQAWLRYDTLAAELIPWLTAHHYTHIELLPLSEHPFDGSWGYQTTGYFSLTSRYGTPAQFAAFVNACHKAGIGVLMDVVPVHFAANTDALAHFDGTCLYEYDSDVGHSEWGTCNFNFYRGEVRSFLCSALAFWMDVYHCDGIRMDAVSRAIYWMGDPARGINEGALRFIQCANHGLNERWPTGIYIAEDSTNYLKVTAPTRYGGLGFDYKWDLGWMHDTLDYFATPFGERPAHYHALTFSMQYFYNELYLLSFSHDEVVHGKKAIIDKLWGTYKEKCSQARALYFYMYTHPGKKLNFMGNEIAHFREWDEAREMDWDLLRYPFHDAFQRYIAALGGLYQSEPALYDSEYNSRCFAWVACESIDECLYAWLRQSRGETLLCILNASDRPLTRFALYLQFACRAVPLLNTEAKEWGGTSTAHAVLHTTNGGVYGRDFTLRISVPAMGGLLYRLDRVCEAPALLTPDAVSPTQ